MKKVTVLVAQPATQQIQEPTEQRQEEVLTPNAKVDGPEEQAARGLRKSTHPTFDTAEAVRLYVAGTRMKDIIAATRGDRAEGATGNLVREACRRAGVYKEPVK